MVSQLAILAMQELIRLVAVNEPFWINLSNIHQDGRYTLDYENYYHVFPKTITLGLIIFLKNLQSIRE
jgi:hypothetical protein